MALTDDEIRAVVGHLWVQRTTDALRADSLQAYVRGEKGYPVVPAGSSREVKDLARISVKNVLRIVVDAFTQNLAVVGYRSPDSLDNAEVWRLWQALRLDAGQAQVYRPALTYGTSYVCVLPAPEDETPEDRAQAPGASQGDALDAAAQVTLTAHSPRSLVAAYRDPARDAWPEFALQTWVERSSGRGTVVRGRLLDDSDAYDLTLSRPLGAPMSGDASTVLGRDRVTVDEIGDPAPHGAGVCPVVRFAFATDDDATSRGEVEPLLDLQLAINAVNFDRLIVSRFGAFPQRYVIGWTADADTLARASSMRVWGFEDEGVKAGSFAAASVEPYNSILEEMLGHVALEAQIPVAAITGSVANLSAEALAMAEAPHQRKLTAMREAFGESWEQVLGLASLLSGLAPVDPTAEVVWKDTQARSFGSVVDGIVKLAQAGAPLAQLIDQVPGITQQKVDAITGELDRAAARDTLGLVAAGAAATAVAGGEDGNAADLKARFDALGVAIRAGVDPADAAKRLGLTGVRFTGATPTSLRVPESQAAGLEDR